MVIQENEELFSDIHPDLMFCHVVTNRGEGKINYELQDLARGGLLADLDYFIIGEIKGAEALYFLNAAYTGHKCWASVHGISSTEAMDKLADYVKYASDYSKEDALRMLHNIDTVVFMKDFKVAEISEIVGWDEEAHNLKYKRVL
jgi:pilus assembly protein CpaF